VEQSRGEVVKMRARMACLHTEPDELSKVPCHVPPSGRAASIQAQGTTWTGKADINFSVTRRSGLAGRVWVITAWSDVRHGWK
jgi:hypothetical protein